MLLEYEQRESTSHCTVDMHTRANDSGYFGLLLRLVQKICVYVSLHATYCRGYIPGPFLKSILRKDMEAIRGLEEVVSKQAGGCAMLLQRPHLM